MVAEVQKKNVPKREIKLRLKATEGQHLSVRVLLHNHVFNDRDYHPSNFMLNRARCYVVDEGGHFFVKPIAKSVGQSEIKRKVAKQTYAHLSYIHTVLPLNIFHPERTS
jgi:hypothetical protein